MKETLRRTLRTFLQSAVGYIAANLVMTVSGSDIDYLKTSITGLLVSAVASGLAATMNLPQNAKNTIDNNGG